MAYQKQEWHDLPLEDTPISAGRLTHMEDGIYEAWEHGGGSGAPIGAIIPYGGTVAPNGYLICDGSQYLKTEYPDLYSVIGTTFNEENDDELHFRVPDIRYGVVPVGMGGDGPYSIGATGGEEEHTLTVDEIPSHHHTYTFDQTAGSDINVVKTGGQTGYGKSTSDVGGVQAHNNMPPYVATNYIIKALDEPSGEKLSETMPIGSEIDYDGLTVPDGWEKVEFISTDQNGWTIINHGTYKEYVKKISKSHTVGNGPSWGSVDVTDLPVGMTSIGSNHFVTSSITFMDPAVILNIAPNEGATKIVARWVNHYSGSVTQTIKADIRILELPLEEEE